MGILDGFPFTCTAKLRTRTIGSLGGSKDSFTTVFTGRACWRMPARATEITEYDKRGLSITDKIYFVTDPNVDDRHILEIANLAGTETETYEVVGLPRADPLEAAYYKVMVKKTTTGSTES